MSGFAPVYAAASLPTDMKFTVSVAAAITNLRFTLSFTVQAGGTFIVNNSPENGNLINSAMSPGVGVATTGAALVTGPPAYNRFLIVSTFDGNYTIVSTTS